MSDSGRQMREVCGDCGTVHGWGNRGACVQALKAKLDEMVASFVKLEKLLNG